MSRPTFSARPARPVGCWLVALLCLIGPSVWAQEPGPQPRRTFDYRPDQHPALAAFSKTGREVLVTGQPDRIGIIQTRTALLLRDFRPHLLPITALVTWPDRDSVVSADAGRELFVWQSQSAKSVLQLKGPVVIRLLVAQPGAPAMALSDHNSLYIWDLVGSTFRQITLPLTARISTLAFNAAGDRLAVGSETGTVMVYTLAKEAWQQQSFGTTPIRAVAFAGDTLFAVAGTPALFRWHLTGIDGVVSQTLPFADKLVAFVKDPARQQWLLGTETGKLLRWHTGDKEPTVLTTGSQRPTSLTIHPTEPLLLATYADGPPRTWLLR